ncbi:hypothetical protein ACOMHN_019457 [Nucella lapillus]
MEHNSRDNTKSLIIIQWNCRSIQNKLPFLNDYLRHHPFTDILMLQSLNISKNRLPTLDGYYAPVVGLEGDRVMVAAYVSSRLGKRTNLINVYYPNGSNSEADVEWLYNLETNQNSWVVAGDFNVSHKLWDTGHTKDSGDHLANTILNSRLVVLNDGSFTRIGQPGQRSSAIDLTLTSPDLSLDAEWTIGTDHLQSDHLPLHLLLHKADPTPAEIDTSPKILYNKADWELLALKLTSECENHDPRDPDINTHYENIRSMILRAAEATIPKKSPGTNGLHQHFAAWWNEECAKSTRSKRRALRHFKKKPV